MSKMGPAASEKLFAEARRREKLLDLQFRSDLEWLLKQPQFRRWAVWLIYGLCAVNKAIWRTNNEMALLEGRRAIGIDVLATFLRFPELYSLLEGERVQAEAAQLERERMKRQETEDAE